MTVAELANKLNTTVLEIFEHYKKISQNIPQDENFILSTQLIRKAIPNYEPENIKNTQNEKPESVINHLADLEAKIEEQTTRLNENFEPYFRNRDKALKEFKQHNKIDKLILYGEYLKVLNKGFGNFINISLQDGNELKYPISNQTVDKIFIATNELLNGQQYLFEATLANNFEREKYSNPFLLKAKNENIREIKELSAITQELKTKQEKLQEISTLLEKAEEQFTSKKEEIEERISKVSLEKQKEANETIEEYNQRIKQSFTEIKAKKAELTSLLETFRETHTNLLKMENLVSTLQDRVSLCKNLQFISVNDEKKYLDLLSPKEFKPANHLDFEKDFEKNFSKLAEYVHTYLFHKKSLIYTRYQIKNFLALLKTHDLIVLSGLSGSGKTQIVKAFAEALGGIAKIIPVKPNWTSSDDLIGYYNPLQMSFLPTPFTEAIVEAINNPNQLYFICLDEMNLARAEYYFADFLSKLEERNREPEIELYANHEEELFVSEFSTLLNLIESCIKGEKIESWQQFLHNDGARKKFFEMLGNTDKESMLQLHAKMKRRLIDILKFPSTIKIPNNVRFIGAINVDETTHYFSPKILDRIHVVKFDNPLLQFDKVKNEIDSYTNIPIDNLRPIYVPPIQLSKREEYPNIFIDSSKLLVDVFKKINEQFLLELNIDFGVRSLRQALNFYHHSVDLFYTEMAFSQIINIIIIQKILPRLVIDGSEITNKGRSKKEVLVEFLSYLKSNYDTYIEYEDGETTRWIELETKASHILTELIQLSDRNGNQFNFFA